MLETKKCPRRGLPPHGSNHWSCSINRRKCQPPKSGSEIVTASQNHVFPSHTGIEKIKLFPAKPPKQTFESVVLRSKTISRTKSRVKSDFRSQNICTSKYEQPSFSATGKDIHCFFGSLVAFQSLNRVYGSNIVGGRFSTF